MLESNITGQIEFVQVPASRGLRRFAEKHISRWIEKRSRMTSKYRATYLVRISREGSGHVFNCRIKIRLGPQTWVGHYYEGGLHQALIQCLSRQMVPIPA